MSRIILLSMILHNPELTRVYVGLTELWLECLLFNLTCILVQFFLCHNWLHLNYTGLHLVWITKAMYAVTSTRILA